MTESPTGAHADDRLTVAGWLVDPAAHSLTRDHEHHRLEPRVMQLLLRLAEEPGRVVTRRTLLADVWGDDSYVGDDALSAAVIKLRKAFGDQPRSPQVIETVPKSGYRLIAPVGRDGGHDKPVRPSSPQQTVRRGTVLRCAIEVVALDGRPAAAETWQAVMDGAAARIGRSAARHGGWVAPESGAVVAVFGAPSGLEHHVDQAVATALEIRELGADKELSSETVEVHLRFGIATGPLVAKVPGELDSQRAVFGEPTQRATALADLAAAGEILLADDTAKLSQLDLKVQPVSAAAGLAGSWRILRLDSVDRGSSAWEVRVLHGLTPLQGRQREIAEFERLLERVAAGEGQVLAVSGEPGVGKSRLLHELVAMASLRGFAVNVGHASPVDRHSPFVPVQSMLRETHGLRRSSPDAASDGEALSAVLEPGRQGDSWLDADPEVRHARVVAAVFDVLFPDDGPRVVAVEDVHWADEATRSLVGELVDRIPRRRCLLVVTYRPEFTDPWATKSYATRLRVDPLGPESAVAMLDELAGTDPSLTAWKARVLDRAGGTPLFIEESVSAAKAAGALEGERGRYTALTPEEPLTVPPSVQGLMAERIDRLPPPARSALCVAAVIGRELPAVLLRRALDVDEAELDRLLRELQAAELLFETTSRYQRTYVFKHAFTQEVAYLGLPAAIRREHHQRIADLLGGELAGIVSSTPELLAWHLEESGQTEDALTSWLVAAAAGAQASAYTDSLEDLSRARRLLESVPDETRRLTHALHIELATGTALVQTAGPTDVSVERAYARARELSERVGRPEEKFEAVWGSWFVHLMRGDLHLERVYGEQIEALSQDIDDDGLALEAHHVQWSGLCLAGRPTEARAHSDIGIDRYRAEDHHRLAFSFGGHDPGVCARNLNALSRWLTGDVAVAHERAEEAVALAARLGHPYSQLEASQAALDMALVDGDVEQLERHASALHALVRDGRLPEVAAGYANGFLGAATARRGDSRAGLEMMTAAAPVWSEFWGAWCFPLDTALAELLEASGSLPAAVSHLEGKLTWARESGGTWWDAEIMRVLAGLRRREGADERAIGALLTEAVEVAADQKALLLELRAATSLVSFQRSTKSAPTSTDRVRSLVDLFPSTVDFPTLTEARRLISRKGRRMDP
ncbi:MAG: BREX system ATP-binding domain-containing protein [Actinomycetes bacterium]